MFRLPKKTYLLSAIFFCFALALIYGDVQELSLEKAIARAKTFNTGLRRQDIQVESLRRQAASAWNSFYPSINSQFSASKANTEGSLWNLNGSIGASFTVSLVQFDAIKNTRLAYENGLLSREQAGREIERSVRKIWYQLATAREQMSAYTASEKNSARSLEQTEERQRAGLASEIDLLNAQIRLEDAKLRSERALTALGQVEANLAQILGLESAENIVFLALWEDIFPQLYDKDSKDSLLISQKEALALAPTSYNIRALEKSLESARAAQASAKHRAFFPALSLSWNWAPATNEKNLDDWQDRGSLSIALALKLDPFLPASSARNEIARAADSIADLEIQYAQAETTFALDVQKLLDSIAEGERSLFTLEAKRQLAERSFELTREAYARGTRDLLALEAAEQTLREAHVQTIGQKSAILEAILDLEHLLGLKFNTLIAGLD